MHESGTNSSLTAQFKTGKTSLQLNMIRALADGEPFLDEFECKELAGNIAFFNYELTGGTLARWLSRMGIVHPERVYGLNLRNIRLDFADDYVVEWVSAWLKEREIEFWVADPLARAYYGDENSNTELKLWTDRVDEIKGMSSVTDFQVTLHTGRGEQIEGDERARGATRIDDWVDARWLLTRDRTGARFIRASGREVELDEQMLFWDEERWRLSINRNMPVSRRVHQQMAGVSHVVDVVRMLGATRENPATYTTIRDACSQGTIEGRKAWLSQAVAAGDLGSGPGSRAGVVVYWIPEEGEAVSGMGSGVYTGEEM
jgi:RecA-family ATPase